MMKNKSLIIVFMMGLMILLSSNVYAYDDVLNVNSIEYTNDMILNSDNSYSSIGDDPYIVTNEFNVDYDSLYGIYLEFVATEANTIEIYWADDLGSFSIAKKVVINYTDGYNAIYIPLKQYDCYNVYSSMIIKQLRLDPNISKDTDSTFSLMSLEIVFDDVTYSDFIYDSVPTESNISNTDFYIYNNVELNDENLYESINKYPTFDFDNISIVISNDEFLYIDYDFHSDTDSIYCMLYVKTEYSGYSPNMYTDFYLDTNSNGIIIPMEAIIDVLGKTSSQEKIVEGIRINFITEEGSFIINTGSIITEEEVDQDLIAKPYDTDSLILDSLLTYFDDILFSVFLYPFCIIVVVSGIVYTVKIKK